MVGGSCCIEGRRFENSFVWGRKCIPWGWGVPGGLGSRKIIWCFICIVTFQKRGKDTHQSSCCLEGRRFENCFAWGRKCIAWGWGVPGELGIRKIIWCFDYLHSDVSETRKRYTSKFLLSWGKEVWKLFCLREKMHSMGLGCAWGIGKSEGSMVSWHS